MTGVIEFHTVSTISNGDSFFLPSLSAHPNHNSSFSSATNCLLIAPGFVSTPFITKERRPQERSAEKRRKSSNTQKGLRKKRQGKSRRIQIEKEQRGNGRKHRKEERGGEGICQARAVPGKASTRGEQRQRKAWNSKKTHNSSLGNSYCSRPIRSRTGDDESKEIKTDRGQISMFTVLDF